MSVPTGERGLDTQNITINYCASTIPELLMIKTQCMCLFKSHVYDKCAKRILRTTSHYANMFLIFIERQLLDFPNDHEIKIILINRFIYVRYYLNLSYDKLFDNST